MRATKKAPRRVIVVYEETRPGHPDRVICTSADSVVVEAVEAALVGLLTRNPTQKNGNAAAGTAAQPTSTGGTLDAASQ